MEKKEKPSDAALETEQQTTAAPKKKTPPAAWKRRVWLIPGILYMTALAVFTCAHYRTVLGDEMLPEDLRVPALFLLFAVLFATTFILIIRSMRKGKSRFAALGKRSRLLRFSIWMLRLGALFVNAVWLFLEIEWINNPLIADMDTFYRFINIVFIFCFLLVLLLLFQSMKGALLAGNLFFLVFSLTFYFVYLFRGEPFQFIDIFSISTAAEVAGGYQFTLTGRIVLFFVLTGCMIAWICSWHRVVLCRRRVFRWICRGGCFAALVVLYFLYMNTSWNGALGIMTDLYKPYKTYCEYGTTVGFLCVGKYMRLTPPENYSTDKVKELTEAVDQAQAAGDNPVKPANIICIMNESWADYRLIGDFPTNAPYMPYYDSLKENTIKGHNLVSIRGGGTAKPEYEFLTGNSVKRFPGMVPFVSYFTDSQYSLATTLKKQGYTAEGMHPNKGSNWKRTTAYRMMGFDRFFDIEHFDASDERIRGHVSDLANYKRIIERVENKKNPDDKYFMFDVTMQNHGGYQYAQYASKIHTLGYSNAAVNQYLSLMKDTDDALRYLIEYFKSCDEPTIICMFGDHYPDLPEDFVEWITGKPYDEEDLTLQQHYYSTPFFIWANYDIPEEENVYTSANYLSTMMLRQTGLTLTPYNIYLSNLSKKMPALNYLGYMDDAGTFVSWDDADETYARLENEYEILQYNELSGGRKRQDDFFAPAQ